MSPWLKPDESAENVHECELPMLLLRKIGRRWFCSYCDTVWIIECFQAFGGDSGRMWMREERALELGLIADPNRKERSDPTQ